jgi:hypothetical protein
MILVYLASPFTHNSFKVMEKRRKQIDLIGAKLQHKHNVAIFPPITISDTYSKILPGKFGHKFESWERIDLYTISKCDEVWVVKMSGWQESVGVQAEIAFAKARKIRVRYIDPKTLRFTK